MEKKKIVLIPRTVQQLFQDVEAEEKRREKSRPPKKVKKK